MRTGKERGGEGREGEWREGRKGSRLEEGGERRGDRPHILFLLVQYVEIWYHN